MKMKLLILTVLILLNLNLLINCDQPSHPFSSSSKSPSSKSSSESLKNHLDMGIKALIGLNEVIKSFRKISGGIVPVPFFFPLKTNTLNQINSMLDLHKLKPKMSKEKQLKITKKLLATANPIASPSPSPSQSIQFRSPDNQPVLGSFGPFSPMAIPLGNTKYDFPRQLFSSTIKPTVELMVPSSLLIPSANLLSSSNLISPSNLIPSSNLFSSGISSTGQTGQSMTLASVPVPTIISIAPTSSGGLLSSDDDTSLLGSNSILDYQNPFDNQNNNGYDYNLDENYKDDVLYVNRNDKNLDERNSNYNQGSHDQDEQDDGSSSSRPTSASSNFPRAHAGHNWDAIDDELKLIGFKLAKIGHVLHRDHL